MAITTFTIISQRIASITEREWYRYRCHGAEPLPTMINIYKNKGRKGVKDPTVWLSSALFVEGIKISNQTRKIFHGQEDMTGRRQAFIRPPHIFLIQSALRISPGAQRKIWYVRWLGSDLSYQPAVGTRRWRCPKKTRDSCYTFCDSRNRYNGAES
jgi:hypothetical protein